MPTKRTATDRIESIRPTGDDPNVVEVRAGGRRRAVLPRTRAEELGLEEGARWTPALAARVDTVAARELAREAAFAMLARSNRARAALEAALVARGHDPAAARDALDTLAGDRAAALQRRGPLAADAIAARLEAEGVRPRDAAAAARDATDADPRPALAAECRAARRAGVTPTRLAGRLARRGFDPDTIREVLASAGYPLDD
jgi:SOS response regulatory protein OraA/RecX